ncbi:MAG: hypothetical protein P4M11_14160 [Candidatus Pacebacteria bacterium]|nr:hypothetical protein [Candidatus Paceibacterota bacterium]
MLTWLSHDMSNLEITARVFDYLICSHPLAPTYIAAAVILQKREEVLNFSENNVVFIVLIVGVGGRVPSSIQGDEP